MGSLKLPGAEQMESQKSSSYTGSDPARGIVRELPEIMITGNYRFESRVGASNSEDNLFY